MSNFKIGDVVKRLDAGFLHHVGPEPHVVTGVTTDGWLQVNHWRGLSGQEYPWYAKYFTLVDGGDDELPPAPESVLYNARSDKGCNLEVASLKANEYYDARIRIGVWNNCGAKQGKVTCLTPDAALQLAHDLRRMAMEIKRKEKQDA